MTLSNKHPQKTSSFQLQEHRFLQVFNLADDLSLSQQEGHKEECKGNFPIFSFWNTSASGIQDMKKQKYITLKVVHPAYRSMYIE